MLASTAYHRGSQIFEESIHACFLVVPVPYLMQLTFKIYDPCPDVWPAFNLHDMQDSNVEAKYDD